ncbi:MAG: cystathionine beta-lyase [Alphaproteobacteria bacterium 13_2_20CM_2_64_7]|nr:MAG: cystathionine beta-lyase [Alphaproteobacteria bacterium 13_2_20CM_2_64_7]
MPAHDEKQRVVMTKPNQLDFSTRCIHAGQEPDPTTGAVMMPIYTTSTYVQQSPGVNKGYDYARTKNPTRMAFERCIADLEGGSAAFAFASGLGAISTTLECLDHGSHIVAVDDLYGGSRRLFERVRKRSMGLEVSYHDLTDAAAIDDNTFASPYIQRPLELGFDLVVHSTTKYLNGHSDMVGGVTIAGENAELRDKMRFLQNAVGAIQGPFDSFLALRGLKTLALRMERHCASAAKIAGWLERHPKVRRVFYPGLASHPQHALAKTQMHRFGGMISAELAGTLDDTRRFLERCRLFALAESLGGVESLIEHPALMTHGSVPAEVRASLGIGDSLVRLSVGIEDADDLIADLAAALG